MRVPEADTVERWAFDYIVSTSLAHKLTPPAPPARWERASPVRLSTPGRPAELKVVSKAKKTRGLSEPMGRARALHTFVHHELQAAELMLWALLAFPDSPEEFRAGLLRIALDEVRHMRLFEVEIVRLGYSIGAFPVRDWFWERVAACPDPAAFVAVMGLGLESANLEHAAKFARRFRDAGDEASARAQEIVGLEEIAHVRFGVKWFAHFTGGLDFDTWVRALPAPLSPLLMRGSPLERRSRERAGQTPQFLDELERWQSPDLRPTSSDLDAGRRCLRHAPVAWVLNLDADLELAAPAGYSPKRGVLLAMGKHRETVRQSLLGPDDVLVDEQSPAGCARGLAGRAFCPTPRAIAMLERAGAVIEAHPTVQVLATVNSRAFLAALGQTLPRAAFATSVDSAAQWLSGNPEVADDWRLKRCFGMSGRGQRVVSPGTPSEDDLALLRAAMREGGVQIEPNVSITREVALHGMLSRDGELTVGKLVEQRCDRHGAWLSTTLAEDQTLLPKMQSEATRVAEALREAGYWGPFGIDAFEWVSRNGEAYFQPRSELNARYSMGWACGGVALPRGH